MSQTKPQKQVNLRLGAQLYTFLKTIARKERRSLSQAARLLLEEGLPHRSGFATKSDDTPSLEIAAIAASGGSFDWLESEPDLYDDTCGEPA